MNDPGVVRTVNGDLSLADLGRSTGMALVHEHLSCDLSAGFGPEYVLQDRDLVIGELVLAKQAGVGLVIDVGNAGHIRDPKFLLDVAMASGVIVVASAGHYRDGFFPADVESVTVTNLADQIVSEIEEGIDGTQIRAGAIGEVGMSGEVPTDLERKVFAASAHAQRTTGVPLLTHTAQGVGWKEQIDMLVEGGADLKRVVIGHMDCIDSHEAHVGVIESGAWLGFDRINSLRYQSDEVRAARLAELIDAGYGERVLLSTDTAMVTRLRKMGGAGYGAVVTEFLPRLRALGVSEEWIDRIAIDNPWRFLNGAAR